MRMHEGDGTVSNWQLFWVSLAANVLIHLVGRALWAIARREGYQQAVTDLLTLGECVMEREKENAS